jgi:acyl carrier protein
MGCEDSMSTFEQVRQTIAMTLSIPAGEIRETSAQTDVGAWDSLGHINLMVALENTFDITLEVEDFARLTSVPAILAYLGGRA